MVKNDTIFHFFANERTFNHLKSLLRERVTSKNGDFEIRSFQKLSPFLKFKNMLRRSKKMNTESKSFSCFFHFSKFSHRENYGTRFFTVTFGRQEI